MLGSLNSAFTGLQQEQESLNVIGNNLANVNTTGYKVARTHFADSFSQTLRASTAGSGNTTGTPALQVGSGVGTAAIVNIYTQGAIANTGVPSDLAISGNGFFVVRDPLSTEQFVTRAGDFRVDDRGFLVTNSGQRVQGYSDSALSTFGDLQIDTVGMPDTSNPTATVASYSIDPSGKIAVTLSDGTQFVRGQVLTQSFQDPNALIKQGNNLYSGMVAAGPLGGDMNVLLAPGSNGLGQIQSGKLELSNVDLSGEFSNLITTQRAFQANAKVVTTSDEILQELLAMKR